ncbi:MAG: glycosyltransferase family 39 protein, partial [Candidatus Nitrotoga sp.]
MAKVEIKRWWWLLLMVAVIWFGTLEYRKLIKPDEGRYAEIPREMVVSGDWVTPRLNDLKYFEKPPLQYWATATAYTLLGEHQWTSRLWPALTGFFGLLLVWFAGTRLFGREAGQYAALILGSSLLYV